MSIKMAIITIAILMYVMLSIIIFVLSSKIYKKIVTKKIKKISTYLNPIIENHIRKLKNKKEIDSEEINDITGKLKDKIYLEAFNEKIIELRKDNKINTEITMYLSFFEKFFLEKFINLDKSDYLKYSHEIYLYGEYGYKNEKIINQLLENINSESTYIRVNSLKSLSKIGNINEFIYALRVISEKDIYINDKIIIDSMDIFEGDKELFNKELHLNLNNFSNRIKGLVITHFTNIKYEYVAEEFLETIESNIDELENDLAKIKYFGNVKYEKMNNKIVDLLEDEKWEIRAISAKIALNYDNNKVRKSLINSVGDSNWFVRYNSAMTIISLKDNKELIKEVINSSDKYARDIMIYTLFNKKLITYDEYTTFNKENSDLEKVEVKSIDREYSYNLK
ncbi:hypothetical protein JCM1393_19540 [Clostridium carnis]